MSRTPNTIPTPPGDAALSFRLAYRPDRRSSGVGTVVQDAAGKVTEIGPVYYDKANQQYWGVVHAVEGTPLRDHAQEVLEDMVRLYLRGSLGERHPTVTAAYRVAQRLRDERYKAVGREAVVTQAAFDAGLKVLAHVLAGAGCDVIRRDLPSLEEAERHLIRWIDAQS